MPVGSDRSSGVKFGRIVGLFIGRDGRIAKGTDVPVTGNGVRGSAAKATVKSKGRFRGKHEKR